MIDLLFWFLVSQTLSGLPKMTPGTEVRLVSLDLLTVYASATVEDGTLVFVVPLDPDLEVRLLIFPPNATEQQLAEALSGASALLARVTPDGRDLIVRFPELDGPLSFRKWLAEERGITLVMPPP